MKKTYKYIICALDLNNNEAQNGIFLLETFHPRADATLRFGLSSALKKCLGTRWLLHVAEVGGSPSWEAQSVSVANVIVKITEHLKSIGGSEQVVLKIPANTSTR